MHTDNEIQEVMDLALDIYDNTDATLEEAMGIAMEASIAGDIGGIVAMSYMATKSTNPQWVYPDDYVINAIDQLAGKLNRAILTADRKIKESQYKSGPESKKVKNIDGISTNELKMCASHLNSIVKNMDIYFKSLNTAIGNKESLLNIKINGDKYVRKAHAIMKQIDEFDKLHDADETSFMNITKGGKEKIKACYYDVWTFIEIFGDRYIDMLSYNAQKMMRSIDFLNKTISTSIPRAKVLVKASNPAEKAKYQKELDDLNKSVDAAIEVFNKFNEISIMIAKNELRAYDE